MRDKINNEYFEWLFDLACKNRYSKRESYRNLLVRLHNTDFRYIIPKDENRAEDGISLRHRFILLNGYEDSYDRIMRYLDGPCSVFEMMVALCIRCEEDIMDDTRYGNRVGQWFWGMITNLGLSLMKDDKFDERFVDNVIERFLNREYDPDGKGGLFRIRNCNRDLRDVEIWCQLSWYLDTIVCD